MNLFMGLFVGLLFVALTPGILVRIPKRGKPLTVALVHGVVFGVIFYFVAKMLCNAGYIEGFREELLLSAEAQTVYKRIARTESLLTTEIKDKLSMFRNLAMSPSGKTALEILNKDKPALDAMNSILTSNDNDGTKFDKSLNFLIEYIMKYENRSGQPSNGECKAYAKEWETSERPKLKLIMQLAANATNEINVLTKEVNDLRTRKGAVALCQKMIAASRGRLNMNGCMTSMIPNQIMTREWRIRDLQAKVKNEMAKFQNFERSFEPACRGKTGCEDLIGKKIQVEAKIDWYCTAKMDKECNESMNKLRDIVSQLAVYKC